MERNEVFNNVIKIARDVFENDEVALTEETTAADVEEWDSLTHINLVSDIENEFDIKLTLREISTTKNIGELVDAIMGHLNER